MAIVSVIVPVYNVAPYLHRCVDSILAQTLTDIEIILVDDGSTDNSGRICNEYVEKDSRVEVLHTENNGQGYARNHGIDMAQGKYIAFVDSDDWIAPAMYESLFHKMEVDSSDLVVCNLIGERGEIRDISQMELDENVALDIGAIGPENYIFDYLLANKHDYSACNKLFKSEIIRNKGVHFPGNRVAICEDAFFIMKYILSIKKISFVNKSLYFYCARISSISTSHTPRLDRLSVYMKSIEDFSGHLTSINKTKDLYFLCPCLCFFFLNRGCSEIFQILGEKKLLAQRVASLNTDMLFLKSMHWLAFGNSGKYLRRYFGFSRKGAFAFRYKLFLCSIGKTEAIIDSIV